MRALAAWRRASGARAGEAACEVRNERSTRSHEPQGVRSATNGSLTLRGEPKDADGSEDDPEPRRGALGAASSRLARRTGVRMAGNRHAHGTRPNHRLIRPTCQITDAGALSLRQGIGGVARSTTSANRARCSAPAITFWAFSAYTPLPSLKFSSSARSKDSTTGSVRSKILSVSVVNWIVSNSPSELIKKRFKSRSSTATTIRLAFHTLDLKVSRSSFRSRYAWQSQRSA